MSIRYALCAALLFAASSVSAQRPGGGGGILTGVIVDAETGETLPSATVALYSARDSAFATGAAADLDGAFRVESVRPGRYQLRASFVGFETLRLDGVAVRPGETTALDTLRLSAGSALLEAEVVGEREFIEQRADRTVYNVQDQAVTTGGSVLETLQTLPSVEVDTDGGVSLRGNQNVVVQINGRPVPVRGAQLAALLRQIPASRVATVEVIPNPSARYDPDGMSGILNIVLAEGQDRGLSGGFTFGGGTQPNAELGANLSYQGGPWDIYASYGYRYSERDFLGTTSRTLINGFSLDQNQISGRGEHSNFTSASLTYSLDRSTTVAFEGSAGLGLENSDNRLSNVNTFGGATTNTQRLTLGDETDTNIDGALVFRRQFDRAAAPGGQPGAQGPPQRGGWGGRRGDAGGRGATGGHELAIELRGSRNNDDENDAFEDAFVDPIGTSRFSQSNGDEGNDEAYLQVDYSRPLGTVRLETGVKALQRWLSSDLDFAFDRDGTLVNDPTRTNAFSYDEGVYAAYVQGGREFGDLGVQAGLRAETAAREFTLLGTVPALPDVPELNLSDTRFTYQSLFPSAFATYALGPGSLVKASYSRRIERPRARSLNPFPNFQDTLSVRVGNPQLRPEYTDAYEITLQYRYFLTVTPFYRRTTDVAARRFSTDPETGVVTQFQQNLGVEDSYGADITLLAQLGPFRGFLSGSVAQVVTDGGSEATGLSANATTYSGRTSIQAKIRQGTDIQFFGFYRAPQNVVDGRVSGFGFASLGLSQKISNQLQLSARVNDLFSTSRFAFSSDRNGVVLSGVRDPALQQATATLTYSFGSGESQRNRRQDQGGGDGGGFDL